MSFHAILVDLKNELYHKGRQNIVEHERTEAVEVAIERVLERLSSENMEERIALLENKLKDFRP